MISQVVWYPKLYDIPLSSYCMISMYIVCLCAMVFEFVWYPSLLSFYCMISINVCVYYISGCMISLYFCVYNTGIFNDIPLSPYCMISQMLYDIPALLYDIPAHSALIVWYLCPHNSFPALSCSPLPPHHTSCRQNFSLALTLIYLSQKYIYDVYIAAIYIY